VRYPRYLTVGVQVLPEQQLAETGQRPRLRPGGTDHAQRLPPITAR
jgi:hypothetical protein